MIDEVLFAAEADDDVFEAYGWYEQQEPGLGEEFLRCLEGCATGIQRHPLMYPIAIDGFRRSPLRRFPYEIFYEVTTTTITIYAVFHCSQDPEKWRRRLRA